MDKILLEIDKLDEQIAIYLYKGEYIKVRELGSIRTTYVKQLIELQKGEENV